MQLGWVEELGSGVLNVNKYRQAYARAAKPQFIEGSTFKIVLPVSDSFFTGSQDGNQDNLIGTINRLIDGGVNDGVINEIIELVTVILGNEGLKAIDIAEQRGRAIRTTDRYLKMARQFGLIRFIGAPKTGGYYITELISDNVENKKPE